MYSLQFYMRTEGDQFAEIVCSFKNGRRWTQYKNQSYQLAVIQIVQNSDNASPYSQKLFP
jgi:predicted metalloprotease